MAVLVVFVVTSALFLAADAVMLTHVLQPLFARHLGDHLLGGFRLPAAVLFYLLYMAGVLWFVSLPALRAGAPGRALRDGAILGLLAYGTYELTSWAVMARWHPAMVATDMAWGAAVTAVSAWAGVAAARALGLRA